MMNNTEKKETFILYGASFNPPHMGHFSAISQMLENYDKVIVFPYPHKHDSGRIEKILPLKFRMKMMEIFLAEFFPKIHDRLILANLSSEIKLQDNVHEGVYHTYDYLKFVQTIFPHGEVSVCLGLDAKDKLSFTHEDSIKKEFGIFYLEEETEFNSRDIRAFFINKKYIRSNKDEEFLKYCLGHSLTQYILKNNIYELKYRKKNKSNNILLKPSDELATNKTTKAGINKNINNDVSNNASVSSFALSSIEQGEEDKDIINVDEFLSKSTPLIKEVDIFSYAEKENAKHQQSTTPTKPKRKMK